MSASQQATERARRAYEQALLIEATATQDFHESMLGAKNHVRAQYGDDSYAVQAIGLTRKSDRKRPARKASSAPTGGA
jgi:hypothetical protein